MRIHFNIGSNMGDRKAIIGRAVALLAKRLPGGTMLLSDYVESEPWGYASPNPYVNRGAMLATAATIAPEAVLDIAQDIEREIGAATPHRNADGSYRDRLVDIDIIDIDGLRCDTPRLTLPHPRAAQRPFVMIPLAQLEERWARLSP